MRLSRCYFQLRDAASLGAATERLGKARSWLQRSHGPNLERMKVLHGDFTPELTTCAPLPSLQLPNMRPKAAQSLLSVP